MTTSIPPVAPSYPGRPWLALGLICTVLGVAGYAVQLALHRLSAPWYLPILATLGVLLVAAALGRKRTLWRALALVLVVLCAGAAWLFLLGARLPAYTGPAVVGQPFPAFTTERADGTAFTERDLIGAQDQVLVFFRGRW